MAVTTEEIRTLRGDELHVTLFTHAGEMPTILMTVLDADGTLVPTAELTLQEAGDLRELLRRFCSEALGVGTRHG